MKVEFLATVYENFRGTPAQFVEQVGSLTASVSPGVTVCSAHQAKGLEADRVFIVAPDEFNEMDGSNATEIQQTRNLRYVTWTRSKRVLFIVRA